MTNYDPCATLRTLKRHGYVVLLGHLALSQIGPYLETIHRLGGQRPHIFCMGRNPGALHWEYALVQDAAKMFSVNAPLSP